MAHPVGHFEIVPENADDDASDDALDVHLPTLTHSAQSSYHGIPRDSGPCRDIRCWQAVVPDRRKLFEAGVNRGFVLLDEYHDLSLESHGLIHVALSTLLILRDRFGIKTGGLFHQLIALRFEGGDLIGEQRHGRLDADAPVRSVLAGLQGRVQRRIQEILVGSLVASTEALPRAVCSLHVLREAGTVLHKAGSRTEQRGRIRPVLKAARVDDAHTFFPSVMRTSSTMLAARSVWSAISWSPA